jgi:quercetin dioxygenase-like cupin family protein
MKRICVLLCLAASTTLAQDTKVTNLLTKHLAGIPGKEGSMLTVEYAPGASSAIHRHNANTFVYVLEGSVVMQVRGGKKVTLGPGQTFYESPDDIHIVSKNASATKPAKFLVFFVKEEGAPGTVVKIAGGRFGFPPSRFIVCGRVFGNNYIFGDPR